MTNISFTICEEPWKIFLLEDEEFEKKFKEALCGITLNDLRQIYICESELNFATVCHELTHAYYFYTCVQPASIDADQMEEIFCEILAIHGQKIIDISKRLLSKLKRS